MTEELINPQHFTKIEMRVATVISAVVFEKAHRPAYIMTLDFGKHGIKKTSAQLTKRYKANELIGKQVIAVINFPDKQIANIMSQCLVLGAVGDDNNITIISPGNRVENGLRIG